jgi:hypothetical protein
MNRTFSDAIVAEPFKNNTQLQYPVCENNLFVQNPIISSSGDFSMYILVWQKNWDRCQQSHYTTLNNTLIAPLR